MHCRALKCTLLQFIALHCTSLHSTLYCALLLLTATHCTVLHFIALHCTSLHSTFYFASLPLTALQRCRCSLGWDHSRGDKHSEANIETASLDTEAWNTFRTLGWGESVASLVSHQSQPVISQWVISYSQWSASESSVTASESPVTASDQPVSHQSQPVISQWVIMCSQWSDSESPVTASDQPVSHHVQAAFRTWLISLKWSGSNSLVNGSTVVIRQSVIIYKYWPVRIFT